jgi:hypothetical protein
MMTVMVANDVTTAQQLKFCWRVNDDNDAAAVLLMVAAMVSFLINEQFDPARLTQT